jgi:TetR/AcrR family transcriptional repressor of nem operon
MTTPVNWHIRMIILICTKPVSMASYLTGAGWMARWRDRGSSTKRIALDAATQCFWAHGYDSTSIKELINRTGLPAASLYNTYGDKRAIFRTALDHYIDKSIGERIKRCALLPPRDALRTFFDEILLRTLSDSEHKGCMAVNSALETEPHDDEVRVTIAAAFERIQAFFLTCLQRGQADGTITSSRPAIDVARHLISVLLGVRVLVRVRPEPALLHGAIDAALDFLDCPEHSPAEP